LYKTNCEKDKEAVRKMGIFDKFRKKTPRAQKIEQTPEKKPLEASALVGTNVLDQGPWNGSQTHRRKIGWAILCFGL